jgi:hypothetical protein
MNYLHFGHHLSDTPSHQRPNCVLSFFWFKSVRMSRYSMIVAFLKFCASLGSRPRGFATRMSAGWCKMKQRTQFLPGQVPTISSTKCNGQSKRFSHTMVVTGDWILNSQCCEYNLCNNTFYFQVNIFNVQRIVPRPMAGLLEWNYSIRTLLVFG